MRARLLAYAALATLAFAGAAHANLMTLLGTSSGGNGVIASSPVNVASPEIAGLDFNNNGTTPALSGTTTTLTVSPGVWTGSVISRAYCWHTVAAPGTCIGTGTSVTLTTATYTGNPIEVDETVSGLAGSATQPSYWFGPIETTLPPAIPTLECLTTSGGNCITGNGVPTSLPVPPAHFLQCYGPGTMQHAVFPGGNIPPCAPNTATGHVWYFDPVNGTTQDTTGTGSSTLPFNDLQALFNSGESGYTGGALWARTINPGDTIYVRAGNGAHPLGSINAPAAVWSTSNGTTTGTLPGFWTFIMPDPAAAPGSVVLNTIGLSNGVAGLVIYGFGQEPLSGTLPQVNVTGSLTVLSHDLHLENLSVTNWPGRSGDPWLPSNYPTSGGASDGTVITATPQMSPFVEDRQSFVVSSASSGSTLLTLSTTAPPIGVYVFSPGYYMDPAAAFAVIAPSTGIPNGSKVTQLNGYPALGTLIWAQATFAGAGPPSGTPATGTAEQSTTNQHIWRYDGTTWNDLGVAQITIGPCDPVADVATGCPSAAYQDAVTHVTLSGSGHDNIPGCDPLVPGITTRCTSSPIPPYAGTTRSISNQTVVFTVFMQVLPAGSFNHIDWAASGGVTAFNFSGAVNAPGSVNPTNRNFYQGLTNVSLKDSMVRDVSDGIAFGRVTNAISFNNKVKWFSQDAEDVNSDHRVWVIHNWMSDPTLIWNHQDAIQAAHNGTDPEATMYYGNAFVDNEMYDFTDPTNPFPRTMQGISNTDGTHNNQFVGDNIINTGTDGLDIRGYWNVVINNTSATNTQKINWATKVSTNSPFPTNNMNANGVGPGFTRGNNYPSINSTLTCDPSAGQLDIIASDQGIPFLLSLTPSTSAWCTVGSTGPVLTNHTAGQFQGMFNAPGTDWSSAPGGTPLFTGFYANAVPSSPNPGWFGFQGAVEPITYCVQNSFPATGNATLCPSGQGINNLRPNASFTPVTNNPGLIGQGTAENICGASGTASCLPFTDHAGRKWATTPAIGAYEAAATCSNKLDFSQACNSQFLGTGGLF